MRRLARVKRRRHPLAAVWWLEVQERRLRSVRTVVVRRSVATVAVRRLAPLVPVRHPAAPPVHVLERVAWVVASSP